MCAVEEDALGVCGGDCAADANGNGVCDSDEDDGGDLPTIAGLALANLDTFSTLVTGKTRRRA